MNCICKIAYRYKTDYNNRITPTMKKKILCIDDSSSAILLLEYALREEGFEPISAFGVNEAIKLLETLKPDLILLDLNMPNISGFDFLEMRTSQDYADIPVIIVSAKDSPETIKQTQELGAVDFISKPVRIKEIMQKIQHHLGN
jgi:two-component system sensor histidine kinase/response regulator